MRICIAHRYWDPYLTSPLGSAFSSSSSTIDTDGEAAPGDGDGDGEEPPPPPPDGGADAGLIAGVAGGAGGAVLLAAALFYALKCKGCQLKGKGSVKAGAVAGVP